MGQAVFTDIGLVLRRQTRSGRPTGTRDPDKGVGRHTGKLTLFVKTKQAKLGRPFEGGSDQLVRASVLFVQFWRHVFFFGGLPLHFEAEESVGLEIFSGAGVPLFVFLSV